MKKYSVWIVLVALVSLLIFWLPFLVRVDEFWGIQFSGAKMDTIVANFDGLNFLVVERTWYDPALIEEFNRHFLTGNEPIYFTAHYPAYAGLIWVMDLFMTGPSAVLASIVVSNGLLALGLYVFFREFTKNEKTAFYLSTLALFLPARMLSVRAVGSTEPLFIFLVLWSLVMAMRKKHWMAAIVGSLAVLVRGPGILLFAGYGVASLIENKWRIIESVKSLIPYLLMPVTLLGLWVFYGWRYGSILAYFQSGDNLHLFFPPFQVFSNVQSWTSGMWLEDVMYVYLIFAIGIYLLWKRMKNKRAASYGAIYMLTIFFVAHRDIGRYSLPIAPLVLAGYGKNLAKSKLKWLILLFAIPAYLWGWNFVLNNIQPVSDWTVFL